MMAKISEIGYCSGDSGDGYLTEGCDVRVIVLFSILAASMSVLVFVFLCACCSRFYPAT